MTITLAAVYAPIGFQGGLTGRCFASLPSRWRGQYRLGVVALTLSPMMGSQLLAREMAERGFSGWINRRFDGVRSRYCEH